MGVLTKTSHLKRFVAKSFKEIAFLLKPLYSDFSKTVSAKWREKQDGKK